MIVRAGVDDRDILAATGVQIQLVFVLVFALGAGLAGIAGVVGGTFQSISPGEDTRFLLASLVVVIVGGMKNTRNCHGFYGASSMERLPVELALTDQVRKFKAIGALSAETKGGKDVRESGW